MSAVAFRLRRRLTRRRAGAVLFVAVVGLLGGVSLATLVGARRNATAFSRLVRETHTFDVLVNPDMGAQSGLDAGAIARLPEVQVASRLDGFFAVPDGLDPETEDIEFLATADAHALHDRYRPKLLAGRLPDPSRADEVLINGIYADRYHVHVGDRIDLTLFDARSLGATTPTSTRLEPLTVTGEVLFEQEVSPSQGVDAAQVVFTPAFDVVHQGWSGYFGVLVWLRHPADLAALRTDVQALVPQEEVEFQTQAHTTQQTEQAIRPETVALAAFAILAAAVTVVVAGQALGRRVSDDPDEDLVLAASGMTPRQRWVARVLEAFVVAAMGATIAIAVAVALSPLFPIGPAAIAELRPGVEVNVAWLACGWGFLTVCLVSASAWPAWRATKADLAPTAGARRGGRSRLVTALASAGAPPASVAGVRMALEPGRGRGAVPVRSAVAGSVVALALLVAAAVFGTSMRRLLDAPAAYGWTWSASADLAPGDPSQLPAVDGYVKAVVARPEVTAAAVFQNSNVSLAGTEVPAIGWRPVRGTVAPTLLVGRLPTGSDELAVGARTLARLHVHLGDDITVSGRAGSQALRVVGEVVFPSLATYSGADNAALGSGALLNQDALDAVSPTPSEQHLVVDLRPGSDAHAVLTQGFDQPTSAVIGAVELAPRRPGAIVDLGRVQTVPLWLAALFGVSAALAIANLVATAVARRRREFAILCSIGFTRGQVASTVAWHATTIAGLTALVAIPFGLIAGRSTWRMLAHSIGVAPAVSVPPALLLLIVPAAVVVANVAAAVPARRAASCSPADGLRAE
jgi:ABC-type lipoprotein release transport system permease subunit